MQALGGKYRLKCHIWGKDVGEDSGTTGANDDLFELGHRWINTDGIQTFGPEDVASSSLDEDDQFQDEIIARFTCKPGPILLLGQATPVNSPKVTGSF